MRELAAMFHRPFRESSKRILFSDF